jgi:myo-inositol-1(or 4)-monophosphatase
MSHANFTPEHLKEIYDFAVQLAKDAGRMLMDGVEARCGNDSTPSTEQTHVEKDSSVDIVTQTDEGVCNKSNLI